MVLTLPWWIQALHLPKTPHLQKIPEFPRQKKQAVLHLKHQEAEKAAEAAFPVGPSYKLKCLAVSPIRPKHLSNVSPCFS